MPDHNVTILIPDISGFTEFMTSTELNHASHAVSIFIGTIIKAVEEEYEVSEIEGDAVLLIRKGMPPSKKEILDTCLKIFNAFHYQRKWMQMYTVCPCGACQAIINLTLKFVVHHGLVSEIKVGRFTTHSGTEMIVAHRLLKNSIGNNEYVLITEKLLQQMKDSPEAIEMEWSSLSEEYPAIGKVEYRFALLNEARKKVSDPPPPNNNYRTDKTPYLEVEISANFRDVYMTMMDIEGRYKWMPGMQKAEQEVPELLIGSTHHCTFENYHATISPLRMTLSEEGIMYAERCNVQEMHLSLIYEFVFKKMDEKRCMLTTRFINDSECFIPEELNAALFDQLQQMCESLKAYCEKMKETSFPTLLKIS